MTSGFRDGRTTRSPCCCRSRTPVAASLFDWHHLGTPDVTDAAVVAALPADLRVALSDTTHRLVAATPCLDLTDVPGPAAGDPAVGKSISQGRFDYLCLMAGIATPWFRARPNVLLLSHMPEHGSYTRGTSLSTEILSIILTLVVHFHIPRCLSLSLLSLSTSHSFVILRRRMMMLHPLKLRRRMVMFHLHQLQAHMTQFHHLNKSYLHKMIP